MVLVDLGGPTDFRIYDGIQLYIQRGASLTLQVTKYTFIGAPVYVYVPHRLRGAGFDQSCTVSGHSPWQVFRPLMSTTDLASRCA